MVRKYKSFFDVYPLTFFSKAESYLDTDGNLISPDSGNKKKITGDLQPYTLRQRTFAPAPSGYTLNDAKYLSTIAILSTIEDVGSVGADYCVINSRKYFVWKSLNWNGGALSTDHYNDYVLLLESQGNDDGV
jgi:hypothetical protein